MRILAILLMALPIYAQDGGATRADWAHYGGTQLSWRYSALDQINTGNVKNLAPAWIFQTGDYAENLHSTPIVVDGVKAALEGVGFAVDRFATAEEAEIDVPTFGHIRPRYRGSRLARDEWHGIDSALAPPR